MMYSPMPHRPLTIDFAAVTHLFPGPTMTSQGGTSGHSPAEDMPYAMAPIACAPPHAEDEVGAGNVRGREGNGSGLGRAEDDVRTSRRPGGDHGH